MSWARKVGAGNSRNTLSINNFPSLGAIKSSTTANTKTAVKQQSSLNPNATEWVPKPNSEQNIHESFGELTIGSGIRLGGGVFGPARVEGRTTISRKTVFKPNSVVQSMMEKMGWIQGKGLGITLHGILVPIDTDVPKNTRYNVNVEGGRAGIGY